MPTYEYCCDACEHAFEEFQSMTEEPLKKCPQCGKKKLRRLFGSGAAILFKGSGFYQTDYRSESYKAGAKADSKADSGKTESKPAGDSTTAASGTNGAKGAAKGESGGKSSGKTAKSGK